MYHQHSEPQGPPNFSNASRPPQLSQNQHQNRPASGMMSQKDFQFPGPTQLPNELQSGLARHGTRDVDHRPVDNRDITNQHQDQSSSQHGSYRTNPVTFTSDNHSGHQQGVDWSSYATPSNLFVTPQPHSGHLPQNPVQKTQSSHTGTCIPNWTGPAAKHVIPRSGGGDGQSLYTAESAGSILASFGLSNDDLEVLSHYPDDQLTPDTLPFILRDIQINKSGDQKTASAPSFSRSIQKLSPSSSSPLAHSRSTELPSLLTVTQKAGKIIDYGHASRAKEENDSRETFKREQLSSERGVNPYSLSSTFPKGDKTERQQLHLKHNNSGKHGDQDYRRTFNDHRKSSRSPGREFPTSTKYRNLDRDYRSDGPKPRPSPKRRHEESMRRSVPSSDSKPHGSSKKIPTPTMIRDFSSVMPKVYPHTCSLCHIQCDQEKDWIDHTNTVNHISACRDLQNKHPDWKADFPSRTGRYGSRTLWDPRDHSSAHSRPHSYSPSTSPPQNTHREGLHTSRPYKRPYSPQHHPQYPGVPLHTRGKRPHDYVTKSPSAESHHPPAKGGHSSRHEPLPASKGVVKPRSKTIKLSSAKAANLSAKPPPEKKKKVATALSQHAAFSNRLVYLTGIPKDASEEEVTSLVGSFGKINNVILIPSSGEQSGKDGGQKASVCMVKPEDAQNLACSTELFIRQQKLTASVAKKPEGKLSHISNSQNSAGGKNELRLSEKNGIILIGGLPEEKWSETDIEKLVQPFGTPSGMILAKQIGKVLVYVPNKDIAEEMVKVNNFLPMKFDIYHLKMTHIQQFISLSTPVALYNALMGSTDQGEISAQVSWSSLLVIQNVPHTSNGSSEVQKLVKRFGTVIRSLVLHNMVICEMATAAMALSVYKRFQAFPCIIQNNPLIFTRKADPKISTQSKTISAPQQSPENKIPDCDMETGEKKTDGAKEENHPSGDNTKLSPTNANAPPAAQAVPELPKNVTQEVPNLLSEAKTGPASQSSNAAASNEGEDEATPQEDKHVKVRAEKTNEEAEGLKTQEKEQKGKETRKENDAKENRERDRRAWEKDKVQRERDHMERARREQDRKEEKRRERVKMDRKSTNAVSSSSKSWKDEKQSSPNTDATRVDTEEEFDPFPFNMSDFVTVDEVGDVADLPLPPSPAMETSQEDTSKPVQKEAQMEDSVRADAVDATVDPDNHTAECEQTPSGQVSLCDSKPTVEPHSHPAETENEPAAESCVGGGGPFTAPPAEGEHTSRSSDPGAEAQQNQEVSWLRDKAEQVKDPNKDVTPAVASAKKAAIESKSNAQRGKEEVNTASPTNDNSPLPPFNPHNPVGMEFLAPKTGFFCKVCNRFFSGAKEAEIAHCKTRKHYDNVRMYLQTMKTGNTSIS